MNRLRNYILSAFAVMLCASGCQWRPLEDPEDTVEIKVAVEIKTVLNVNVSIYNELIPVPQVKTDMFRVMFYDPNTGKLVSQAFLSEPTLNEDGKECLGGSVKIGVGTYDMLCYNFDTPDTYVSGENSIQSIYAYTNGVSESIKTRYQSKAEDGSLATDDIRYEPDHLLVAREMGLKIGAHTGLLIIETEATTVVDTYYIQIFIEGAEYANTASAILSGMSPSNHFGLAQRDTEVSSSVYFELQKSKDLKLVGGNQDVLCCTFNTFGKIYPDGEGEGKTKAGLASDSELIVNFNVVRTDGKIFEYKANMNDIFNSEDAIERHWLLINDKIVIPKPDPGPTPSGGGGFQPQVGEWDNINSDITL